MRFSVVIATLARPEPLRATIESVLACDPVPHEVLVVDADPERTAQAVAEELGVRAIAGERGLTRQRNRGIREATGDIVVFLDDDVEVEPSLFEGLAVAYADPTVVGVTGRIVEPGPSRVGSAGSRVRRVLFGSGEGTFTRAGYPRRLSQVEGPADVEYMQGCFMSARRELAERVGFDEGLAGYALAEDEDFGFRLSRLGRVRYVPALRVVHKRLGFTSHDSRAFGRLVVRNRRYLFRKNFPQTLRARAEFALLLGVLVVHRLVNREWRGALGLAEGALAGRR
jgi:GT2 family glycosyltransferase